MSLALQSLLPYPNSCLGASPHQQGRDTKMAMLSFGGIDVSKDRLDITVLPDEQCSSVSNDAAGWAELIEQLRGSSITAIGVEASGGYERGVVRALLAAGMSVRQINPFKLRQLAKARGTLAKNDRLDARMIASFVAIMPTRPAQRQAPMIEQLAAMLTVRRQLSDHKVATENVSRLLEGAMLQRLSRRRIAGLTADIDLLDQRLVEIVTADPTLAHRFRLLTSMPGVGAVLACTLIALLPELGQMSRKQVAALVGLAPYDFDSGKLKGRRCIWGGRARVRHGLYMAAMSASNWNPGLKAFQDRLEVAGKKPKVTIVAVMRKMITTLNAMVRDDVVWADRLSSRHSVPTAREPLRSALSSMCLAQSGRADPNGLASNKRTTPRVAICTHCQQRERPFAKDIFGSVYDIMCEMEWLRNDVRSGDSATSSKEVTLCLTGTVSKICWRFCTDTLRRRLTRLRSIVVESKASAERIKFSMSTPTSTPMPRCALCCPRWAVLVPRYSFLSVSSTLLDPRFSVTRKYRSRYALQGDLTLVVRHCWR